MCRMTTQAAGRIRSSFMVVLAAGFLVATCTDPAEIGGDSRHLGILQLEGSSNPSGASNGDNAVHWDPTPSAGDITPDPVLVAPDTIAAGQPFNVTVHTIGESGCWGADGMKLSPFGRTVELKPYDVHSGHEVCTAVILNLEHGTSLTLDEPGEWLLRVSGRKARRGDESWEIPVKVEKTIVVQ